MLFEMVHFFFFEKKITTSRLCNIIEETINQKYVALANFFFWRKKDFRAICKLKREICKNIKYYKKYHNLKILQYIKEFLNQVALE